MFHFLFSRNMCIFHVFLRKDWDDPIIKNMLADSLISNNPRPSPFWKITLVVNRCNFKDSLGLQCIRSYTPPKLAVCILKIGCLAGCRIRFQKVVDAQTAPHQLALWTPTVPTSRYVVVLTIMYPRNVEMKPTSGYFHWFSMKPMKGDDITLKWRIISLSLVRESDSKSSPGRRQEGDF